MHSDLLIPRRSAILAAARDVRESAARLDDTAALRCIDRLIDAISGGARFCWADGVLLVHSTSGSHYRVSRSGCTCANGQHGQSRCWHWMLRGLLESMLEERAALADDEADRESPPPPAPIGAHSLGVRLAAARAAAYGY